MNLRLPHPTGHVDIGDAALVRLSVDVRTRRSPLWIYFYRKIQNVSSDGKAVVAITCT